MVRHATAPRPAQTVQAREYERRRRLMDEWIVDNLEYTDGTPITHDELDAMRLADPNTEEGAARQNEYRRLRRIYAARDVSMVDHLILEAKVGTLARQAGSALLILLVGLALYLCSAWGADINQGLGR